MEKRQAKPIDLREYAEEAVPFEQVIRRLGAKPITTSKKSPKHKKASAKRK